MHQLELQSENRRVYHAWYGEILEGKEVFAKRGPSLQLRDIGLISQAASAARSGFNSGDGHVDGGTTPLAIPKLRQGRFFRAGCPSLAAGRSGHFFKCLKRSRSGECPRGIWRASCRPSVSRRSTSRRSPRWPRRPTNCSKTFTNSNWTFVLIDTYGSMP